MGRQLRPLDAELGDPATVKVGDARASRHRVVALRVRAGVGRMANWPGGGRGRERGTWASQQVLVERWPAAQR